MVAKDILTVMALLALIFGFIWIPVLFFLALSFMLSPAGFWQLLAVFGLAAVLGFWTWLFAIVMLSR